ncbi:restriction endonuclease subunit S [Acidilutibacter cellobiosedens]|jgi:type I restriction enzyme S subunit|uniref:Restriction endonuclease subunit S n=1 Tax=Acidilutibacter cellobiosedens TaxID=2507161 RepID=A0A410QFX6_9FIRM|nr:restriction endonuclease subunit S [Acidilutibacter cellobiosedens]QAT62973.1 restriction endonuclease subunit S [Acidilutibacter cellobiosedens]
MKWENKKFIDFIQLQRGHDLTREQFIDGPYPVVSSTSIMGYHNQYKADGPGVVIGRSGTLGKAQYINDNYWPHNTTLYVKDYKGNYPRFVYYFLMNFSTDKHGGGSAVPTLNRNTLSSISIRVPDFTTQKRIADILSAYDDLIENNQKQIKLLEEAAMWLYKEWFVKLRFPGHEKTKIEDGVPEGWKLTRVKRMGQVITGKTPSTAIVENYGEDIPFVKIPDMHGVIYPLKTEVKLSERGANTQKNKFLPPKSIMVSCIATVGLVCITHEVCQTNQQINSIVLNDEDHLYYMFFKMKGIKSLLEGVGSNGATMTNVNKTKFENIELLKPENEILKKFNNLVEPFFSNILALSKQNEKLKEARDKLLSKLMSGEIEV